MLVGILSGVRFASGGSQAADPPAGAGLPASGAAASFMPAIKPLLAGLSGFCLVGGAPAVAPVLGCCCCCFASASLARLAFFCVLGMSCIAAAVDASATTYINPCPGCFAELHHISQTWARHARKPKLQAHLFGPRAIAEDQIHRNL